MHLFKDPQTLLVPVVHLSQQGEVISCVLLQQIVLNDDQLNLLHVKPGVHLYSALVNQINNLTLHLNWLRGVLQSSSTGFFDDGLHYILLILFLLVFVEDGLEYLLCLLLALVKAVVVSANHHYSKVHSKVANIDMQNVLLRNTRDANWRPSLTSILHAGVCINVVHQHLDVLWLHFAYLLWICENGDRIH